MCGSFGLISRPTPSPTKSGTKSSVRLRAISARAMSSGADAGHSDRACQQRLGFVRTKLTRTHPDIRQHIQHAGLDASWEYLR